MRREIVAAVVLLLVACGESAGHRLDEYLQAARISLARDHVALEVDLTPGASLASAVIAVIDRDGDHTISPLEAEAYGRVVLSDLVTELDGRPVALTLSRVAIPSIDEMRDGVGTIQLHAVGPVKAAEGGRRQLRFRNNHRPEASDYLANALIPEDGNVRVVGQTRDPRQREVLVDYQVDPRWPSQTLWLVFAASGLPALIVFRRGRALVTPSASLAL